MRQPIREKSIAYKILMSFKDLAGDLAYITLIHPPRSMREGMYLIDRRINERTFAKGVSRLKRQGFIKEYRKSGERYIKLAQKGRLEMVRYKMKHGRREVWDGKWRIVIFDIPEATRKDRDFLRNQLRWLGFFELQKSVWVFLYEVQRELTEFIKLCKLELNGDVRFLTIEKIDADRDLRRNFGLK